MPRKKTTNLEPEMERKLEYIGLKFDKIPKELIYEESLSYRIPREYENEQYKQYRYIKANEIQILLTPTNRLDSIQEKYEKARPVADYLDNKSEENFLRHTIFLNMIKQMDIEEIEKIEEEQKILQKGVPFGIKYANNYLWQIHYSEETNQYFMLVPTQDSNYSVFFYLLKLQLQSQKDAVIYAPVIGIGYSKKYLSKTAIEDLRNYLWLFTKEWPSIYEIYDSDNHLSIHIIGETIVYENIKTPYHVVLNSEIEASHFYKLLKAMFILQTEIPNYFIFSTDITSKATLEFYCKDRKIEYADMAKFIKDQYSIGFDLIKEKQEKQEKNKARLEELKQEAAVQEIEYLEKEKQISTFLECKKTFFGKFRYYFKYSKKSKKNSLKNMNNSNDLAEEKELENSNINNEFEKIENKGRFTIEELIETYKKLENEENTLKNIVMDINALKLKNKNMAKKIENATLFIEEIDNHKRSIFEFWKYSNKDEISVLPEGEEEEVGVTKFIEKAFDFSEDFENFGKKLDLEQREKIGFEETDSIYIASTNCIDVLNKIKTGKIEQEDLENLLKDLKDELKQSGNIVEKTDFDIFGGMIEPQIQLKKIGNITHREAAKDKFHILEITRMTRALGFKLSLERIVNTLCECFGKIKSPEDITVYKAIVNNKIDENEFNIFDANSESVIKEACMQDGEKVNLYKLKVKQGDDVLGFSNIVYYDNYNRTLPTGMNFSSKMLIDISKLEWNLKKSKVFHMACFENPEIENSKPKVKEITVYE